MQISRMTTDELQQFARADDCLDKMVPSDLRNIVNRIGGDNWEPISTAPRDGTIIDLWISEPDNCRATNCYWDNGVWRIAGTPTFYPDKSATHWKMLPVTPETLSS